MPTYSAYKIASTGDRAIENAGFVIVHDADAIKQWVEFALKLSKKDWFLNLDEGINYFDNDTGLLGAKKLSITNEGEIIEIVLGVPGVESLVNFDYNMTHTELTINITALTIFGQIKTTVEVN